MANQTISLKNQRLNTLGPSPTTKWNSTFNWTASGVGPANGTWGIKSAASFGSLPILKNITMQWTGITTMPVSGFHALSKTPNKTFSKPLVSTWQLTDKEQSDGRGFTYLFPDRTTNAENEFYPVYASLSTGTASYTCLTTGASGYVCNVA